MSDVRRPRARRALLAVAWAGGSLAALVGVYVTAVRTPRGQALDTALMLRLGELGERSALAGAAADVLGWVSPASLLLGTVAVGLLVLAVSGGRAAGAAVATVVVTTLAAQVLKLALERPGLIEATAGNSLPSGHAAAVAGLAAGLVVGLRLHASTLAWLLAATATGATGLATVVLQWHRPSDIVASALLAVLVAVGGWLLVGREQPVRPREHVTAA